MPVEVLNATFVYPGGVTALKGVSLSVDRGERIALVGHNGSGKSTLARLLNGLLVPVSGRVLVDGIETGSSTVASLAARVALLFQNPDDQLCKRRVWDEAAFGPRNLGYNRARVDTLVRESLALFGLEDRADANPFDLGRSERKRLALASVLAMDTGLVVLDEPTAGLDCGEAAMLAGALQGLKSRGKAVVVISHDMDFVAENCARAVCLEAGEKRFDGPVADLFGQGPLLEKCGLLPSQIARLCAFYGVKPSEFTPQGFPSALRG